MLTLMDWFAGAGGSSQGADAVPGVTVALAANHWNLALDTHATNFPNTTHKQGDIRDADVHNWPVAELHWASPECTKWSLARGKKRNFTNTKQGALFDVAKTPQQLADELVEERSRALMSQVPDYLEGVISRGRLVLAGVVENVIDERAWDGFDDWLARFHRMGYKTRVIALNSMHAAGIRTLRAPQSRDRLYVGYWHTSLGRHPDWDKWLRPRAFCPGCDEIVPALQVFKNPRNDMGRYRSQYLYRCPRSTCRNEMVEPAVLPALAAIDLGLPTRKVGDGRPGKTFQPYAPATVARIKTGMARYWAPLLTPTGGTWRTEATPLSDPMPTRTTRENDAVALPPLIVPTEGRDGKYATPASDPGRTQTTRRETGVAFPPPFIIPMRGGGDKEQARPIDAPLHTVTAGGNHHGLITPEPLLVPYYTNGTAKPAYQPVGALTTKDRYGLATTDLPAIDVNEVGFRMLEPREIARGMAFGAAYTVLGSKRDQVTQLGNAVTPPVAELLISALVETITGTDLEPARC
ncbi:DNA cytosine methyltransferase [Nonomuraea sp. NBC_01738]|uniref:DNA cytosine methyltransferase n=1 Tax=Nonomuraea sp. NBC_01738 TaxID=2976003 RepID=UPI002E14507D|nr:DNA cytosine methyltransferase [Nonomuraea sp. NBC_01738]